MSNGNLIEINLNGIKSNVKQIIDNYDYEYYIGVVKSNAYGCGYFKVIETMEKSGINYFAVSNVPDALNVRKYTNKGILILTPISINEADLCIKNNISITIESYEYLREIKNINNLKIHIKINSGMNRFGLSDIDEINKIIEYSNKNNIFIEGIYTHLYYASNSDIVNNQIMIFNNIFEKLNYNFKMVHVMNSEGLLLYNKFKYTNGIRIGDLLYGLTYNEKYSSVYSLKTNIIKIIHLKKDDSLGYDAKYKAKKDELIAIVPIGYADGIIKCNSGRYVHINNSKYKIIGNICMCSLFVKVDDKVKINDIVYIIKDSKDIMNISKYISKYYETAPSEITTIISKDIKKIYME